MVVDDAADEERGGLMAVLALRGLAGQAIGRLGGAALHADLRELSVLGGAFVVAIAARRAPTHGAIASRRRRG
ncbi:MAG: hypothetical protein R3F65_31035 [bacterium]